MKQKLNCILLIEDDEATNFIHKVIITKLDCTNHVEIAKNGLEAIDYLKTMKGGGYPKPELILLDINMPKMNGWEFLEEYQKLDIEQKGDIVIVMLTTSLNVDDAEKANSIKDVTGFRNKPMSIPLFTEILQKYFPERV